MKYSIWAIPPDPINSKLRDIIRNLSNDFNGPIFEPHMTILGNIELDLQQITGLFAAFSPLKSVSENKRILINFLNGSRYGHTSLQMNKAELILQTNKLEKIDLILSGRKTTAFHRHLYNPLCKEKVCVDTHLIKYFNKGSIIHITPNRYSIYENAVKKWSNKVNMYPSEIQAILWILAKQKYGINV